MAKRKTSKPGRQNKTEGSTDNVAPEPSGASKKPVMSQWQRTMSRRNRRAGLNIPSSDLLGWLMVAAENGRLDEVKRFIDLGADVNAQYLQFFNHTPLSRAVIKGDLDVVNYLVEHGANVNRPTGAGETPLTIAAQLGNLDVVKYLVEHGAEVDSADKDGDALACAIHSRQMAVYEYLKPFASPRRQMILDRRLSEARRSEAENERVRRLSEVCYRGLVPTVRRLLKQGIDVDGRRIGVRGQSPLRLAARRGHTVIVGLLLEAGADPDMESYEGKTPLMDVSNAEVCRMLLEAGADVNAVDDDGRSVLASIKDEECRRLLIKDGAK